MSDGVSAAATQRIITVLQVLADHPGKGINVQDLLAMVGSYEGTNDSQRDSLSRDLRYLRKEGHVVENIAGAGEEARYVLRPGDDRVRVSFTAAQLFQLQRAAVLVGVDRLGAPDSDVAGPAINAVHIPDALGEVQRAVATSAKIRFEYSGRIRTLHPYGLRIAQHGWVLEGWEEESGQGKVFNLQKMSRVRIDRPATASAPERAPLPTLDPLRFELDPPAAAQLQVSQRFRTQVEAVLNSPIRVEPGPDSAGEPTEVLHYSVTNHRNFLTRVLRLDERVVLLGGDELRDRLHRMLLQLTEAE